MNRCCKKLTSVLCFVALSFCLSCLTSCKNAHDGLKNPLSEFEGKAFTAKVDTNSQDYVGVRFPTGEAAIPSWPIEVDVGCNQGIVSALGDGPFSLSFSFDLADLSGGSVLHDEKTVDNFGSGEYAYDWGAGDADQNGYGTPFFKAYQYVDIPMSCLSNGGTISGKLSLLSPSGSTAEGGSASWGMAFASDESCFWYTLVNELSFA